MVVSSRSCNHCECRGACHGVASFKDPEASSNSSSCDLSWPDFDHPEERIWYEQRTVDGLDIASASREEIDQDFICGGEAGSLLRRMLAWMPKRRFLHDCHM